MLDQLAALFFLLCFLALLSSDTDLLREFIDNGSLYVKIIGVFILALPAFMLVLYILYCIRITVLSIGKWGKIEYIFALLLILAFAVPICFFVNPMHLIGVSAIAITLVYISGECIGRYLVLNRFIWLQTADRRVVSSLLISCFMLTVSFLYTLIIKDALEQITYCNTE